MTLGGHRCSDGSSTDTLVCNATMCALQWHAAMKSTALCVPLVSKVICIACAVICRVLVKFLVA